MNNKICLITGCNSGIGKVTAIELAKKGFEILEDLTIMYQYVDKESGQKSTMRYFLYIVKKKKARKHNTDGMFSATSCN